MVTSSEAQKPSVATTATAAGLYASLQSLREPFLRQARYSAELTIPTLVPPEGHGSHTKYYTPFQGIGARGVNNLASKLLLALFPPNSPFFRLAIDPYALKRAGVDPEVQAQMEKALSEVEKAVQTEVEVSAARVSAFEALRQLIVAGNALIHVPKDGNLRCFKMDTYVVQRDMTGNLLDLIIQEQVAPSALTDEVRAAYAGEEYKEFHDAVSTNKNLTIYTRICRKPDGSGWDVYQEICGKEVPGTRGNYHIDRLPYIALRFNRIDGEDYGRGYVEEYIGDLRSLEALSQAIVEGSAAAARVLFLVTPNSTTKVKTVADAANGAVLPGNATDVTTVQLNKSSDFRVAQETMKGIEERLAYAFLLNSAIQRNAERVTAEEIRFMAQELESSLGGTYSVLSQEFQLPLVSSLMDRMKAQKRLPKIPKKLVRPVIITGVEALGRGNDLNKLDLFVAGMAQTLGPEAISQYLNVNEYLERRATALGIELEGLIRSPEEVQAMNQQAQQMQMLEKLGPTGIKSVTDIAMQQGAGGQAAPEAPPQQQ